MMKNTNHPHKKKNTIHPHKKKNTTHPAKRKTLPTPQKEKHYPPPQKEKHYPLSTKKNRVHQHDDQRNSKKQNLPRRLPSCITACSLTAFPPRTFIVSVVRCDSTTSVLHAIATLRG